MTAPSAIRLTVRADDMGATHSANRACLACGRHGIVRSVEVIVPGPWFPEAAALLTDLPAVDVGVHLTLTSEWRALRWRPLTCAASLVDADGFFPACTSQDAGAPPGTGFLQCGYRHVDVERELRAQIELGLRRLPRVTHLSSHMGAPTCLPHLHEMTQRLADEYGLLLEAPPGAEPLRVPREAGVPLGPALARALDTLSGGSYLFVEHPAYDDPESRALEHGQGPGVVARQRADVTAAFTDAAVMAAVARRGIVLAGYARGCAAA